MQDLLLLAHKYDDHKHKKNFKLTDYLLSQKLEGMRAFWDGGCTKNMKISQVPWANLTVDRSVNDRLSTGLWTRLGRPIFCPEYFTEKFPKCPLDGELYLGVNTFQKLMSLVKPFEANNSDWNGVSYCVFDSPNWVIFTEKRKLPWGRMGDVFFGPELNTSYSYFEDVWNKFLLPNVLECENPYIAPLHQHELSGEADLDYYMSQVFNQGGEGVMLRHRRSFWLPKRSKDILKVKFKDDDEALVVDIQPGEGQCAGRIGSLIVNWQGKVFNIGTGFTLEERLLLMNTIIGKTVKFSYRGLTEEGIPKEARFVGVL